MNTGPSRIKMGSLKYEQDTPSSVSHSLSGPLHPIFIFFPSHLCIFCKYGINIEKRTYGNGIFFPSTSSTEKIIRAAVPAPLKSTHFFSLPRHLPFVSANPSFTAHSAIHILRFIGVRAECLSKILSYVFRTHHQGCLGVPAVAELEQNLREC